MRTIDLFMHFKAMSVKDRTWIYGDNVVANSQRSFINNIPVIYDTICQSLGREDCNGNLIYTGDLLKSTTDKRQYLYMADRGLNGETSLYFNGYRKPVLNTSKYRIIANIFDASQSTVDEDIYLYDIYDWSLKNPDKLPFPDDVYTPRELILNKKEDE